MGYNKNKFLWKELTMNADGKSSASGFIGLYLGLIAGAAFASATIGYFLQIPNTIEVMGNIVQMVFAISLLLGVRKAGDFIKGRGGIGSYTGSENSTESSEGSELQGDSEIVEETPAKPNVNEEGS